MKKLLIGCGILVLLLVIGMVVIGVMFKDDFLAVADGMANQAATMIEAEQDYPFTEPTTADEFDAERFLTSLDVRVAARQNLDEITQRLENLGDSDLGFMDKMKEGMSAGMEMGTGIYEGVATALQQNGMGHTELVYHSKVLWAALRKIDSGAGDPALAEYRGFFAKVSDAISTPLKVQMGAPSSLGEFADGVPADVVDSAIAALGSNVQTLQNAFPSDNLGAAVGFEPTLMALPKWVNDMRGAVEANKQALETK